MYRAALAAALATITSLATFACSSADPLGTPLLGDQSSDTDASIGANPANQPGTTCTGGANAPAPQDPSKLPACCSGMAMGAAHCVAAADVPASISSELATCPTGVCVPDPFITNPMFQPKSCMSINGAGVCLSVCIPQVAQYVSILKQDSCAADEKCAPCTNPLNNMPSGACSIGSAVANATGGSCDAPGTDGGTAAPHADAAPAPAACPYTGPPLLDPSTLPSCDPNGGAHCVSAALVPPAMASMLATCPTGLCAPDVFIESGGNYIPPTCVSVDGAEGRCLSEAVPQVASQLAQLPVATCKSYERCVPCYSPLDGTSTGACKLSCDPGPKSPPTVFKACCTPNNATTPQGKCVPTASVPATEQSNLDVHECVSGSQLCVPSEMLAMPFKPTACTGSTLLTGSYTGVCLSTCLKFGFFQSLGISQGSCDDLHECAPCTNPLTGQPSGAPGCP